MPSQKPTKRVFRGERRSPRPAENGISAFAVSIAGAPESWGETIVNARSRGQAKVEHWRDVRDAWPDIPFTRMRARRVGRPESSAQFIRNAHYRGLPDLRCGDPVTLTSGAKGVIVGHDASANFEVLFDVDSPKYPGLRLSVHPIDLVEGGVEMMALTLAQPYATLAAHGFKRLDGRAWRTAYRGPVAIYAARWRMGLDRRAFKSLCFSDPFRVPIYHELRTCQCLKLPRGCIVGVAELVDSRRIDDEEELPASPEREFGIYGPLRCIWTLEAACPLPAPVPVRQGWARSGLWRVPRPLKKMIHAGGAA